MTWMTWRRMLVPLVVVLIAAAACGSSDTEPDDVGVASLSDQGGADGAATDDASSGDGEGEAGVSDAEAPDDPELAFALFDECMADAGFDFGTTFGGEDGADEGVAVQEIEIQGDADPQGSGDFDFGEEFQAAEEECEKHLANLDLDFDLSPEQEAAMEDAQIAWTECMREQGVDLPDFDASGSGNAIIIGEAESASDPQAGGFSDADFDFEAFEEANEACEGVFEEILGDAGLEFGTPEGS